MSRAVLENLDVSPEYYFKRLGPELYTVAKFIGTKLPLAVYTIRKMRYCDCLGCSRHGHCQHIPMLKQWITAGKPLPRAFDFYDGYKYGDHEQSPYAREE
jgi:hypothetical protein